MINFLKECRIWILKKEQTKQQINSLPEISNPVKEIFKRKIENSKNAMYFDEILSEANKLNDKLSILSDAINQRNGFELPEVYEYVDYEVQEEYLRFIEEAKRLKESSNIKLQTIENMITNISASINLISSQRKIIDEKKEQLNTRIDTLEYLNESEKQILKNELETKKKSKDIIELQNIVILLNEKYQKLQDVINGNNEYAKPQNFDEVKQNEENIIQI